MDWIKYSKPAMLLTACKQVIMVLSNKDENDKHSVVSAMVKYNTNDMNMNNLTLQYLDALQSKGAEYIPWSERHKPGNLAKLKAA
jgi:hypothetical protein